jgi:segregation and condensation protein A
VSYAVRLDNFEGPLDLLLHLIKKHEMDIYDIPIAEITAQYLATLDAMQSLNLDVAGEFLVMAATLLQIKSRLLLPQPEEEAAEEEEEDPRAELVRRLLEYQKYKEAALSLDGRPQLGREVFARVAAMPEPDTAAADGGFEAVGIYELVEALRAVLAEAPPEVFHEVDVERLSVTERVTAILSQLEGRQSLAFGDLFEERPARPQVVVTFLALLELVRLRLVKLMQNARFGPIWLFPAVTGEEAETPLDEDNLGYA